MRNESQNHRRWKEHFIPTSPSCLAMSQQLTWACMTGLWKSNCVFKLSVMSAGHLWEQEEIQLEKAHKTQWVNSVSIIVSVLWLRGTSLWQKTEFQRESWAVPSYLTQQYHMSVHDEVSLWNKSWCEAATCCFRALTEHKDSTEKHCLEVFRVWPGESWSPPCVIKLLAWSCDIILH